MDEKRLAVIRVRGNVGIDRKIKDTLQILRLYRKNYCVVFPCTPSYLGAVRKVKDYTTFGFVNDDVYKLLVQKRGEEYKGRETDKKGKIKYKRFIVIDNKKIKLYFRLNPPRKGFGRKGIKKPFSVGGALGDRKEKINDLILRML